MADRLDLARLARELRDAGVTIDLRQLLEAQQFLFSAAVSGLRIEDAATAYAWLAPILCAGDDDRGG